MIPAKSERNPMRSDCYFFQFIFSFFQINLDGSTWLCATFPSLGVTGDHQQIFRRKICRQPPDIQQDITAEARVKPLILETCLQVAPTLFIRVAWGKHRLAVHRVLEISLRQICCDKFCIEKRRGDIQRTENFG